MTAFFFNALLGTEMTAANVICFLIFVALNIASDLMIIKGGIYLYRNWFEFSPGWQKVFAWTPLFTLLLCAVFPVFVLLSFPLGLMALSYFMMSFLTLHQFQDPIYSCLFGYFGVILNILGLIGLGSTIEKKRALRRSMA